MYENTPPPMPKGLVETILQLSCTDRGQLQALLLTMEGNKPVDSVPSRHVRLLSDDVATAHKSDAFTFVCLFDVVTLTAGAWRLLVARRHALLARQIQRLGLVAFLYQ